MRFCDKKDIKAYIKTKKEEIKQQVDTLIESGSPIPRLAIIQVGNNPASERYINGKLSDCKEVGVHAAVYRFPEDISKEQFETGIYDIVYDDSIHGVIIQKPLPAQLEIAFKEIVKIIPENKDVDGFRSESLFDPCTPLGIIDYIEERMGANWLTGKAVTIINRTELVGKPLAKMLLDRDATVTTCHSKTTGLERHCYSAEC